MSNKKRKLSPSLSSASSSTPIPATATSPPPDNFPIILSTSGGSGHGTGAGSSRAGSVSGDATPVPSVHMGRVERSEMKMPNITPGTGDGKAFGDECFVWQDLPMQTGTSTIMGAPLTFLGYRYMPCGLSPIPSPNPSFPFYRTIPPPVGTPKVHLSWLDRSPFLRSSPDSMTASTDRGFCSARANISVREGTWYYEVQVERGDGDTGLGKGTAGGEVPNAHFRMGWGRREAILDAPVGFDGYSYGIRDTGCQKVHLSRRKTYGEPSRHLRTGDTIGCLITLPTRPQDHDHETKSALKGRDKNDPAIIKRARAPLRFKGQMYLESEEYRPSREMEAKVDREGKILREAEEAARLATVETNIDDKENGGGAKISKGKTKQTTKTTKGKNKDVDFEPDAIDRTPTTLPGSSISFFLNGEPVSDIPAFEDLYDFIPLPPLSTLLSHGKKDEPVKGMYHDDGTLGYYPMISVFGRGKVKVNFGPEWSKPPADLSARPMCDRYPEFREEERIQDELDEAEWIEKIGKEMKEAEDKKESLIKRKLAADGKRGKAGSRGRGRGGVGGTSTPTPRSRLGTESTPGPPRGQTPSSPQSESGVKMEVESVMDGGESSRAPSLAPERDLQEAEIGLETSQMLAGMEMDTEDNQPIAW
jgi:COMPASS component BRE2